MAKSTNGLGQFRGKLGGAVFAVNAGEQIVRQYQPQVANPRTSAQLSQRAKMNLTGKLSSIIRNSAIMALGINNRDRRSVFTANILRNATVTIDGTKYTAAIAPESIIFSKGNSVPVVNLTATYANGAITITATKASGVSEERYNRSGMRYVVLGLSTVTGEYDFSYSGVLQLPAFDAETGYDNGVVVPNDNNHAYFIYGIPFDFNEGYSVGALRNGELGFINNAISTETFVNESSAVANYGKSFFAINVGAESGSGSETPDPNPGGGGGGGDLVG